MAQFQLQGQSPTKVLSQTGLISSRGSDSQPAETLGPVFQITHSPFGRGQFGCIARALFDDLEFVWRADSESGDKYLPLLTSIGTGDCVAVAVSGLVAVTRAIQARFSPGIQHFNHRAVEDGSSNPHF